MDIVFVHLGETPPKPPRYTRRSMPKSRTGCITCKIRHVKCDEGKPECLRCTNTRQKCGGYHVPDRSKAASGDSGGSAWSIFHSQDPERQLTQLPGTAIERRAIEFFYHRTVPQLSGLFSHSFWSHFVLQFNICEPAIRHAMIAVSTIHEATEDTDTVAPYSTGPTVIHDDEAKFAFLSYSNAIHFLIEEVRKSDKVKSLRVPLTACIILICAEFMRGNIVGGITHIESGVKILKSWRAQRTIDLKSSIDDDYIETQLVPYFTALNIINSIFGRPSNGIYSNSNEKPQYMDLFVFHNTVEARTALFDILNAGLSLMQSVGEARYWIETTEEQRMEQLRITNSVENWNLAFKDLAKRCTSSWTFTEIGGADLLRVVHLTTKLWFWTALSPYETEWDKHKDDYEKLLDIAERLVEHFTKPEKRTLAFSFELGCIPPLHFVAWKCRWPLIRRRALYLLDICERRECLFDSRFSYSVFSRIMQVEEESFGLPPGQVPGADDLPPEEARIHQMNVSPDEPSEELIPINLLSKPDGPLGEWHIRREYIQVGEPKVGKSTSTSPLNDLLEELEIETQDENVAPYHSMGRARCSTSVELPIRSANLADLSRVNVPTSEAPIGSAIQSMGVYYTHSFVDGGVGGKFR